MNTEHLAIYPGSFDPMTLGHVDVIKRARSLFDNLVIAIGQNPDKPMLFSYTERLEIANALVEELLELEPDGCPVRVEHYTGLTVDFARKVDASAIIRGIRNTSDVASECQLAITNRKVADIETVFIVTGEEFAYTSSSLIKQFAAFGGDLNRLRTIVSPLVIKQLEKKLADPATALAKLAAHDQLAE